MLKRPAIIVALLALYGEESLYPVATEDTVWFQGGVSKP